MINLILFICFFYFVRCTISSNWATKLAEEAHKCNYKCETVGFYLNWHIIDAIFNPLHFNKWTSKQWITYQQKLYPPKKWGSMEGNKCK